MNSKENNLLKPFVHITVWGTLIGLIFLNANGNRIDKQVIPILEAAILFYLNYLFLVDNLILKRKRYATFIVINVVLILIFRFDIPPALLLLEKYIAQTPFLQLVHKCSSAVQVKQILGKDSAVTNITILLTIEGGGLSS